MKLVDRYLFRELLPPFLAGILVFTFLLLMSQVLRLMEVIVNKGVGTGATLRLILYLLPSLLVLTVPMSVFLATVVTFGRLSAENELTAFKTGGDSLLRLSAPVALFAARPRAHELAHHQRPAGGQPGLPRAHVRDRAHQGQRRPDREDLQPPATRAARSSLPGWS